MKLRMSSPANRKVLLGLTVLALGSAAFACREQLLAVLSYLGMARDTMPLEVAGVLILLKTVSAPIGFPGTPLTLLTGSLFGPLLGTLIALIGNTMGAVLAFLLARYVLQDYVQTRLLTKYGRIHDYVRRLESRPMSTVVALRLIPLFPFNALNFLLGVTTVPLRAYALGSFVGMIPGTFAFVYLGGSLAMLSGVNIALAVLGIIALIYFGNYYERRFT